MRIAAISLGAMGSRIAHRLLDAGHDVVVWNRTATRAAPLARAGAAVASTPAEAATSAEQVITMLADRTALMEVMTSPEGLGGALRPGQVLVEMSTVGPAAVAELVDLVSASVALIDAPVLGSIGEADAGTLQIFVGGTAVAFESVRPTLAPLGTPRHLGPLGMGATAKLVANITLLGSLTLLGEALGLARALGLEQNAAFDVLAATPLAAQAERRRPAVEDDAVPLRFRLALAVKDAGVITREARDADLDPRLMEAALAWFEDALQAGAGDEDYSTIVRHIMDTVPRSVSRPRMG